MRILVVDDDAVLAAALTRALTQSAYSVDLADNGEDANRSLGSTAYDLVVLDIALPGQDGLSVLRRLRDRRSQGRRIVMQESGESWMSALGLGSISSQVRHLTRPRQLGVLLGGA